MLLFALAASSLAAWIHLAFFRDGFWLRAARLEPAPPPTQWPSVAAVIPARDEAETIGDVVAAHLAADYPGPFDVTVVDDASSDGTAALARAAAAHAPSKLRVVAAPPLRPGWSGKLNAVAAGVAAAQVDSEVKSGAPPKYLLLTDADIRLALTTLRRLVAKAEADHLSLASLMARLDARGIWGALLIPAFIYFFQQLYPFPAVNDPARRTAAAAGGCMLVRADALADAGGIEAVAGALIDDCALADLIKNGRTDAPQRHAIWLGLADREAVSLRDNRRLSSIWSMVARNAFTQLRRSWALLAATTLGMLIVYATPPTVFAAAVAAGDTTAAVLALSAWVLAAATYFPTARLYGAPAAGTLTLPLAGVFYTAMTVGSAIDHARGKGGRWKGRVYTGAAH